MTEGKRKQLFVDPAVQGALIRRVVVYWVSCLLFITVPIFIGRVFTDPQRYFFEHFGDVWSQYWPVLIAVVVMLPFVLYDVLRITNRFAGPLYRLRREMRRLAAGETVASIHFREGDFWSDLADSFNQVADRVKDAAESESSHAGNAASVVGIPEEQSAPELSEKS